MSDNTEESSSNALVVISDEYTSASIGLTMRASSEISDKDNNMPRIICNELIVEPRKSKSLEKLDELSSLEREIAEMHHADDTNVNLVESRTKKQKDKTTIADILTSQTSDSHKSDKENSGNVVDSQEPNIEDKIHAITSGETPLDNEDLIAVLKGIDSNINETHINSGSGSVLEGVTIEGEGEYQIMEVIDDDSNATEDVKKEDDNSIYAVNKVVKNLNKGITSGPAALTPQEERALALEQMEGLKTAQRSRKQEIKAIKQMDNTLELVSALEADWSENEEETNEITKSDTKHKNLTNKKSGACIISDNKTNAPLITNVVVIPSVATAVAVSTAPTNATTSTAIANVNVCNNYGTRTDEVKTSKSLPTEVVETKSEEQTQSQSGFRRTRIIKRKIIWDPDAPETAFSYAKLVKPDNKTKNETISTTIKKGSTTITPIKKESLTPTTLLTAKKTQRPATPKTRKSAADLNIEKTNLVKSENLDSVKIIAKREDTDIEKTISAKCENTDLLKIITEKEDTQPNNKTEDAHATTPALEVKSSPITTSPIKRRSQTPISNVSNCATSVKKKKISEVDRLMGDEGAVNMLNSLEKLEATLGSSETKSTRPMMRSRAATICEKLPRKDTSPVRSTTVTPPTATNIQTNKGKRTPKSRASSSWDYVYKKKKQDFDDSLIIRRRSNSSYSSTTSVNRLSLDGPPALLSNNIVSTSSTKSNDSISSPAQTNDSSKTPRDNSNLNKNSKARSTPTVSESKLFEFAKPESKKSQKRTKSPATTLTNDMKKAAPVANKRRVRSPATTNEDKGKDATKALFTKCPTPVKDKKDTTTTSVTASDVIIKKSSKVAQILFSTNKAKLKNTFTIQMLHKLVDILDKLATDPECHVIVIGTNDAHFCQGIDFTDLTTIATEKRKNYAVNLATSVKNYLKTLATYPKPIVAGVNGNLMNLGVIQLALFDVVIASEKSTFEAPYTKMGQTPEGYCIWHNMNKIRGSFKTKLFWLCEKVQSTEAALAGLVNKLTITNKVNDDALITAKRIATLSAEPYRVMKRTIINTHLDAIENCLDEEFNTIVKQWTSNEFLENLKKHLGQD